MSFFCHRSLSLHVSKCHWQRVRRRTKLDTHPRFRERGGGKGSEGGSKGGFKKSERVRGRQGGGGWGREEPNLKRFTNRRRSFGISSPPAHFCFYKQQASSCVGTCGDLCLAHIKKEVLDRGDVEATKQSTIKYSLSLVREHLLYLYIRKELLERERERERERARERERERENEKERKRERMQLAAPGAPGNPRYGKGRCCS